MRTRLVTLALVVAVTRAIAQPVCDACMRGDALIDLYALGDLRPIAGALTVPLSEPLSPQQYTQVIELRTQTPALLRVGALDDADIALVAAALCHGDTGSCAETTTHTLRCVADRCDVALPVSKHADVVAFPENCNRYTSHKRPQRFGVGFDWGDGYQRSKYPADGHAFSFGIETRLAVTRRIGAVGRVDRSAGRDEGIDMTGDERDDRSTGSITRIAALAGPSFLLDFTTYEETSRFLRLDLLGGYVTTRSQAAEAGPAAGFDLAYQIWRLRAGIRVVQGVGGAAEATMLMGHLGAVVGSEPAYDETSDCNGQTHARRSRLALAFDIPLAGYAFTHDLGYVATGLAFEVYYHLSPAVDIASRADVMLMVPGDEADHAIHQAVMLGLRVDHSRAAHRRSSRTGWFTTAMLGYTHGAVLSGSTAGSGPLGDVSLGWGGQEREAGGWFRVHARFGLGDNTDYRALFLSTGFELRFDGESWRDRL